MRNRLQVLTVPVNTTTGPLQQMMESICWIRERPLTRISQFLLVLTCILKAVNKHADLLRESAADPGNDHRLGANEAPPAIISVFLGEQLEDVLEQLISTGEATHSLKGGKLETGVSDTSGACIKTRQTETVHHRLHLQETNLSSVW